MQNSTEEDSTHNATVDPPTEAKEEAKADAHMEDVVNEKKQVDWSGFTMSEVYNQENHAEKNGTPA